MIKYLSHWRTEVYLTALEEKVVRPRQETKDHLTKLALFTTMKNQVEKSGRNIDTAYYYKDSMRTKAFESLKWYANT